MRSPTKISIFILLLVLVAVGIYEMKKMYHLTETQPVVIEPSNNTGDKSYKIYSDEAQFSFNYAKDLVAVANHDDPSLAWNINAETPGFQYVRVTIPKSTQPNTNFSDSWFTVGASKDSQALKECLTPTNEEQLQTNVVINGVTFTKMKISGAGMSNYYDTTSYRAVHGGFCFAVEYTVHSTSLAVYSPEQHISQFDTQAVVTEFEKMIQSFKFI